MLVGKASTDLVRKPYQGLRKSNEVGRGFILADVEKDLIKATVRGFSRAIILWLVSQEPMSGYRIVKEMKRLTGQSFHPGIVYPLLYELEEKGFTVSKWRQRGRRRINYYSITEEGTKLLERLRELFEMPVQQVLKDFLGETPAE